MNPSGNTGHRRDLSHRSIMYVAFIILGVICVAAATWHPETRTAENGIREVFIAVAIAVATGLLVAVKVEWRHLEKLKAEIVQSASETIGANIRQEIALVAAAAREKLIAILPPRQDKENAKTRSAFEQALLQSTFAKFIGVSMRGSFIAGHPGHRGLLETVADLRDHAGNHDCLQIEALFLDPLSLAAEHRQKIEHRRKIVDDVATTHEGIQEINDAFGGTLCVKVGSYDFDPQVWAIITDHCVFVEFYHSADAEALGHMTPVGHGTHWCVGGRVPVWQFEKESAVYRAVLCHFETLWALDTAKKKAAATTPRAA